MTTRGRTTERLTTRARTTARSTATMIKQVIQLTKNKDSVVGVKTMIQKLTTPSGRNNRGPAGDCDGVENFVKTFIEKLNKNPRADVSSEYTNIIGTELEAGSCKNSKLNTYVDELDTITTTITKEIKTLQDQIKGKWN